MVSNRTSPAEGGPPGSAGFARLLDRRPGRPAAKAVVLVLCAVLAATLASLRGAGSARARPLRDRVPPTTPTVVGPRRSTTTTPMYRFSARDGATPTAKIRFRCAFDSRRLHGCRAR